MLVVGFHKDNPQLTRSTFRIVAFLSRATQHDAYEWEMAGLWSITPEKHIMWIHVKHTPHIVGLTTVYTVVNVSKTWENVMKPCPQHKITKDFAKYSIRYMCDEVK